MSEFQDVVTVFLTHRSKILVLKRSGEVGTYKGHWAGVSGYLESNNALAQALTEMAEEVGLGEKDVTLLKAGKPLEVPGVCILSFLQCMNLIKSDSTGKT
jgi:ADP-ribose pyrophosphatase YjhB (NUDIX family)